MSETYEVSYVVKEVVSADWVDQVIMVDAEDDHDAERRAASRINERHNHPARVELRSITRYIGRKASARSPRWIDEALNEGAGVYIP